MVKRTKSIETSEDHVDQALLERILTLNSARIPVKEISKVCGVKPALVQRLLSTIVDIPRIIQPDPIQERTICNLNKRGKSLSQIAKLVRLSEEQVVEALAKEINKSVEVMHMVFQLKDDGISIEEISSITTLDLSLLGKIFPLNHMSEESKNPSSMHQRTVEERIEPDRIYSHKYGSSKLYWTDLKTGIDESRSINHFFKYGSSICEVLGGPLIITGGRYECKDVVSVDVRGDFSVITKRPMISGRRLHNTFYYKPYVYVLGGVNDFKAMSECERYICNEDKWEAIPPIPRACMDMGVVVSRSTLLVLGGYYDHSSLDLVQELSLVTLAWRILPVKLPKTGHFIACFSAGEVYFVMDKKLFTLRDQSVKQVKVLSCDISSDYGPSYYRNGTIYTSSNSKPVVRLDIGKLS